MVQNNPSAPIVEDQLSAPIDNIKKYYIVISEVPHDIFKYLAKNGELPWEQLKEVTEEEALLNHSKAILYGHGFSREDVKSFFSKVKY